MNPHTKPSHLLRRLHRDAAGNVAVLFGLVALIAVGFVGAAVDYSGAAAGRARLQAALDAAVLAGVAQSAASQVPVATAVFDAAIGGDAVVRSFVPGTGELAGTASASIATSVLKALNIASIAVTARATARIGKKSSNVCILLDDPTLGQALLVNSGATIKAPSCEIHVRSTANPAAIVNSGTSLDVKRICVKGANVILNSTNPPLEKGCAAIDDPLAGTLPAVTPGPCIYMSPTNGSTVTMTPGTYCGDTNFNGSPTITFQPGLYVVKGGAFNINSGSTVNGQNVTFYLADQNSTIRFNGGMTTNLSAPTSGTYANILFFEAPNLPRSPFVFNGSVGENFQGLVYLPSRDVTFNSNSNVNFEKVTMVLNSLIINKVNWSFETSAKQMFATGGGTGQIYLSR